MNTVHSQDDIGYLFVIALPEEFEIFRRTFSISEDGVVDGASILYRHQLSPDGVVTLECLTLVIGDQGPEAAASATGRLLTRVSPKMVVNLGISGRTESDFHLGDVVIATEVDNPLYRAKAKDAKLKFAGRSYPLLRLAEPLSAYFEEAAPMLTLRSELNETESKSLGELGYIGESASVRFAPIFATPIVADDEQFVQSIKDGRNRLLGAADMESGAVVAECWKAGLVDGRVLVIRGLSDPANGRKREIDQVRGGVLRRIAMTNAATVAWQAVKLLDLKHQNPRVSDTRKAREGGHSHRHGTLVELLNSFDTEVRAKTNLADACKRLIDSARAIPEYGQLPELARSVFQLEVLRANADGTSAVEQLNRTARDFLVAHHVMACLDFPGTGNRGPDLYAPLHYVYPQRINRFCKALMALAPDEKRLTDSLIAAADRGTEIDRRTNRRSTKVTVGNDDANWTASSQTRAHACYLLGRLQKRQHQDRAAQHLQRWLDELFPLSKNKNWDNRSNRPFVERLSWVHSSQDRMLLRTILISLVLLGKTRRSDDYVKACLRDRKFDELNRGFHLEYYGDIEYDTREPMSHVDDLRDFPNTFAQLYGKVSTSIGSELRYPLRDVELQTLLSLCQHRHAAGKLAKEHREMMLSLLDSVEVGGLGETVQLRGYTEMVRDHLREDFRPDRMIRETYRLKKQPRSGWLDAKRNRLVGRPESILEHIGGGLMLIHQFVPEQLPDEDIETLGLEACRGFSKGKILRMFLVHDWAEAYTGDLLPGDRSDETWVIEELTMSKIDHFCTYDGVEVAGTYSLWKEFDTGSTINSKIANDIDVLENLLQLEIENEDPSSEIGDYATWKVSLINRLRTPLGKRIAKRLAR